MEDDRDEINDTQGNEAGSKSRMKLRTNDNEQVGSVYYAEIILGIALPAISMQTQDVHVRCRKMVYALIG